MKYKVLIFIAIILTIGILGYQYIYQDHRNIQEEKALFKTQAKNLKKEFSLNDSIAESKYNNKTISITGNVSEIKEGNIILNGVIFCQFLEPIPKKIKINQTVSIKGRFIGYDDLLEYINLDQCAIKN